MAATSGAESREGEGKGWKLSSSGSGVAGHESFESDGVSSPVAIVGSGVGIDKRGGEYCMQSDFTIFVMRAMLLFEEHMNLNGVSYDSEGEGQL